MKQNIAHANPTDQSLALAARNGNREARNTLYLRHRPLISKRIIPPKHLARALALRGAPITTEDVEQEAFLIFCRLLQEWQPERTQFIPFLSETIQQAAYDYVRGSQHLRSVRVKWSRMTVDSPLHPTLLQDDDAADEADIAPQPTYRGGLRLVDQDAATSILNEANWEDLIGQLRDDWARLLRLRFWEDKSSRQIAGAEHRSLRSVNRDLQSALAQVHDLLPENWGVR